VVGSRTLRLVAARTRVAAVIGAVVAGAAIGVPVTARASFGVPVTAGTAVTATLSATLSALPATVTGLACRTLTHCIAVGGNSPQMATQMVGERWDGKHWSRVAMPKPSGASEVATGGVACPSDHECMAVGTGYPYPGGASGSAAIVERWNGARWTAVRAADPGSSSLLEAISCPSAASCYAVGSYTPEGESAFSPLIEHWNGKKWAQQTAPVPHGTSFGSLADVSCPSAKFCVAVGTKGSGELIERWNGSGWSATTPPSPSSATLYGVSCPTTKFCAAVGSDETAAGGSVVERWNGTTWSGSTTPVPSGASYPVLGSVSCVSATHCLAVGDDNPGVYAASWNGHGWRPVAMTATGGRLGEFVQIRCLAAASCVALAATTQFAATALSESAFWNGTRWKVVATA